MTSEPGIEKQCIAQPALNLSIRHRGFVLPNEQDLYRIRDKCLVKSTTSWKSEQS